ncbi:type II toxin-antitoxin system HicB family antitoxin [Aquisphaera insulae]|uniref:type II toxin-antitoxin system HicB family antitoxin n=1 Tax=Aquisphaera insulae TaxID=2712864 RepID=UPI0013EC2487|nr:type II toxin-antitoxin system HicB family antitoxin [Aquisphaera insulae]
MNRGLTMNVAREGDGFVAHCPELDIASQADSIEAARDNLREAIDLFLQCAPDDELERRLKDKRNGSPQIL